MFTSNVSYDNTTILSIAVFFVRLNQINRLYDTVTNSLMFRSLNEGLHLYYNFSNHSSPISTYRASITDCSLKALTFICTSLW